MVKIRDEKCEICNRFSHCNNNNLVCISKFLKLEEQLKESNINNITLSCELQKALEDNHDLKNGIQSQKCPICGEEFLSPTDAKYYGMYLESKNLLDNIKKIVKENSKLSCGAGGQSMNIMEFNRGKESLAKEILNKLEEVDNG